MSDCAKILILFGAFTIAAVGQQFEVNVDASNSYPIYTVNGTHYEIGYQVGKLGASRINDFIDNFPDIGEMRTFILTAGATDFRDLVNYNMAIYPSYFDELQGLSEGSGAEYTDILLLSFKHEIKTLINNENTYNSHNHNSHKHLTQTPECSDILLNNETNDNFRGFGHNEDGWNGTLSTGFFVNATYSNTSGKVTSYFAFQYPGIIIGDAFGFNNMGLTVSGNVIFPNNVTIGPGVRGIYFLERAILDCDSIKCAIDTISTTTDSAAYTTYGGSINIGQKNGNDVEVVNVEVSSDYYSVLSLSSNGKSGYNYHFNNYLRLTNVSALDDASSDHRLNRTLELIAENDGIRNLDTIIEILGDTQDDEYPIYRTSKSPDEATTLATVVFDIANGVFKVYQQCNPKQCQPSILVKF